VRERLVKIPGVRALHAEQAHFHEAAFALPKPAQAVIEKLAAQRFLAGVALGGDYAGQDNTLLVFATETKTAADPDAFAQALATARA
jgi:glycine dehydrogenase subunit 1